MCIIECVVMEGGLVKVTYIVGIQCNFFVFFVKVSHNDEGRRRDTMNCLNLYRLSDITKEGEKWKRNISINSVRLKLYMSINPPLKSWHDIQHANVSQMA
jgi:hypothetical protein